MELGFRLVLFALGILVIIGMVWDMWSSHRPSYRSKKKTSNKKKFEETVVTKVTKKDEPVAANEVLETVYVMAHPGHVFNGSKLFKVLCDCELYFGQHQIFHKYSNKDGSGEIVFSVASAFNPGILDPDTKDNFSTRGLVLFATNKLPGKNSVVDILRTAKIIAARLDGAVVKKRHEQQSAFSTN